MLQLLVISKCFQILHSQLSEVPEVLGVKFEVLQCGHLEWLLISSFPSGEPPVVAKTVAIQPLEFFESPRY